jgi:hypothetical protein
MPTSLATMRPIVSGLGSGERQFALQVRQQAGTRRDKPDRLDQGVDAAWADCANLW